MSAAELVVEEVWYAYGAQPPALRGVSFVLRPGERLALIGRNGSGKTTLARHLNGLLRPRSGRVLVDGLDTARHPVSELAARVGYVFQNPDHQLFSRSTREELAFGPRNLGLAESEVRARVEQALRRFALEPLAEIPPAVLGFAQRRLVAVAAVVAMQPAWLVLDEPFAGLSWPSIARLGTILAELSAAGHGIVLITHQMRAVAAFATRCLVLEAGEVLADRGVRETLVDRGLLTRAALDAPAVVRLGQLLRPVGFSGQALRVEELVEEYARLRQVAGRR